MAGVLSFKLAIILILMLVFGFFSYPIFKYSQFAFLFDFHTYSTDCKHLSSSPPSSTPKIFHYTWINNSLPFMFERAYNSCVKLHPDYEHKLWTDDEARTFIASKYPDSLSTFDSYRYPIQRADALRYFALDYFGGIYIDLDIECRKRFDPVLQWNHSCLLPMTAPVGVSNDLMVCSQGHPLMKQIILGLPKWNLFLGSKYLTVFISTGPSMVSYEAASFLKKYQNKDKWKIFSLKECFYGTPFIEHQHQETTWHGTEGKLISFLYNNLDYVILFIFMYFCLCAFFFLKFSGIRKIGWTFRHLLKEREKMASLLPL